MKPKLGYASDFRGIFRAMRAGAVAERWPHAAAQPITLPIGVPAVGLEVAL